LPPVPTVVTYAYTGGGSGGSVVGGDVVVVVDVDELHPAANVTSKHVDATPSARRGRRTLSRPGWRVIATCMPTPRSRPARQEAGQPRRRHSGRADGRRMRPRRPR